MEAHRILMRDLFVQFVHTFMIRLPGTSMSDLSFLGLQRKAQSDQQRIFLDQGDCIYNQS